MPELSTTDIAPAALPPPGGRCKLSREAALKDKYELPVTQLTEVMLEIHLRPPFIGVIRHEVAKVPKKENHYSLNLYSTMHHVVRHLEKVLPEEKCGHI